MAHIIQTLTCSLTTHHRTIGPCPPPLEISDSIPSVENEKGYHGCIIVHIDNTTIIEGYGPADGRIEDTASYRTEVCGTIAVLAVYGTIQSI
jgi:hypothetical protein